MVTLYIKCRAATAKPLSPFTLVMTIGHTGGINSQIEEIHEPIDKIW